MFTSRFQFSSRGPTRLAARSRTCHLCGRHGPEVLGDSDIILDLTDSGTERCAMVRPLGLQRLFNNSRYLARASSTRWVKAGASSFAYPCRKRAPMKSNARRRFSTSAGKCASSRSGAQHRVHLQFAWVRLVCRSCRYNAAIRDELKRLGQPDLRRRPRSCVDVHAGIPGDVQVLSWRVIIHCQDEHRAIRHKCSSSFDHFEPGVSRKIRASVGVFFLRRSGTREMRSIVLLQFRAANGRRCR